MRVIVTGASGFLGGNVLKELSRSGVEAIGVSRQPSPQGIQVGDYSQTPEGDVLVHLAEDRDRSAVESADQSYADKATAMHRLLFGKRYRRVVYASSAVLYGDEHRTPRKPNDPTLVKDVYTQVKRAGEEAALATGHGVVARLANVYGPGMARNNVVSTVLDQLRGNEPLRVWDASPVRDFIWVTDVAQALSLMATVETENTNASGIYNVGSGVGVSVEMLVKAALDTIGTPRRPIVSTRTSGRISSIILDVTDTTSMWGWRPRTDLRAGLEILISNWHKSIKSI